MAWWTRLEGMGRSDALTPGLEARVADPLWMLARQWQIGELRGDDAARPVGMTVSTRSAPISEVSGPAGSLAADAAVPMEYVVERRPRPSSGHAATHDAVRLGHRLVRMLANAGFAGARPALAEAFPSAPPDDGMTLTGLAAATEALLVRLGIDGAAVLDAPDTAVRAVLAAAVARADLPAAMTVVGEWRAWCLSIGAGRTLEAWDDEQLAYRFSASTEPRREGITLRAPSHDGGLLDWFSFDLRGAAGQRESSGPVTTVSMLPTPVRFRGQPAERWWEFEDAATNLADIDAGPADLARMLVAEYAVAYSADWFVLPVRVPVGTLTEVVEMRVVDNFGDVTEVRSVADVDHRAGGKRVWRMFELTGDEVSGAHRSPWLFVPSTVHGDLTGDALEQVGLVRDEGANLVWAVERLVEGPAGRALNRRLLAGAPSPATVELGHVEQSSAWTYHLESGVPPAFWIPFVPERISEGSAEVRLRRARLSQWSLVADAGPRSELLDPSGPRWIREEQVPASGVQVERRWRYARGHDGTGHLWQQFSVTPASGQRSSGLRWDLLDG